MSDRPQARKPRSIDTRRPIWERFFTVAPLVVVGTREEDGSPDLAPKHMAGPVSWQNFFGFVCSPTHATYANAPPGRGLHRELPAAGRRRAGRVGRLAALRGRQQAGGGRPADASGPQGGCAAPRPRRRGPSSAWSTGSWTTWVTTAWSSGRVVACHVDPRALRRLDREDQEVLRTLARSSSISTPTASPAWRRATPSPSPSGFSR